MIQTIRYKIKSVLTKIFDINGTSPPLWCSGSWW